MAEAEVSVLLVDDDIVDVMNIRRGFEKNNLHNPIYEASNGSEALEILRGGQLPARRVVVLDLNMPKMTGVEFLRALRADPTLEATNVVVLTTSNEERDRLETLQLNVAGYLIKPVSFSSLLDLIAALNTCWALVQFQ